MTEWNQGFYAGNYDQNTAAGGYPQQGYDMQGRQFPQEQQFQEFEYDQSAYNQGYSSHGAGYSGQIMTPDPVPYAADGDPENFENEPPLLEELGINFDHIHQKTLAVLNPLKQPDHAIMQDTDMAGPLLFCMAFGASMMLGGKLQFGYIYGIGVVGCIAMYGLLNLMSLQGVSASCIISVLGYCLLPMVILSFCAVPFSLTGVAGTALTAVAVLWCAASASKLFVSALAMERQQLLVAYPCALVYGVFALLTVF